MSEGESPTQRSDVIHAAHSMHLTVPYYIIAQKRHNHTALYNAYTLPQVHIRMYNFTIWTRTSPRKPQSAVNKTVSMAGNYYKKLPVQCMHCMAHDHRACTLALYISSNNLLGR